MTETIRVLDKGFVRLVDAMGDDDAVVLAARVSYGAGSKGSEKDRKLVNYLLRHKHMTPFEHAVLKFHVSCPLFVMRQWIRHRSSCVTGDTRLYFDLPSGPRHGRRKVFYMTVEDFHRKWHDGALPIPHAKKPSSLVVVPQRPRLARMLLRNLDEDKFTFGHSRVVDIFRTGEKPVFEVALEDGKKIRCTKDHRFFFKEGWKTLADGTSLDLSGDLAVYRSPLPQLAVNGRLVAQPLYRDKEWLEDQYRRPRENDASIAAKLGVSAEVIRKWRRIHAHHVIPVWADAGKARDRENLATLCARCHRRIHTTNSELEFAKTIVGPAPILPLETIKKPRPPGTPLIPRWVRIAAIRYVGIRPTFDLTVEGPHHNYVANGIVTHNSYNEVSARYTEVRDEFYVPEEFRGQDVKNKQGSAAAPAIDQARARALVEGAQRQAYDAYRKLLDAGVARELSRMVLPVNLYTQFYWTINARNLMHFIELRADAPAQWEIQRYAEALASVFRERMPWTWEAFLRYHWSGVNPRLDAWKRELEASAPAP